jgi:hypothetical protein
MQMDMNTVGQQTVSGVKTDNRHKSHSALASTQTVPGAINGTPLDPNHTPQTPAPKVPPPLPPYTALPQLRVYAYDADGRLPRRETLPSVRI